MENLGFTANPNGDNVLSEYQTAVQQICVMPSIMATSTTLNKLKLIQSVGSAAAQDWTSSLLELIKTGFGVQENAAKNFRSTTPIADGNGNPFTANLFVEMNQFYIAMSWEKPYLLWAVSQALKNPNKSELQIIAGLMCRGARECVARKRSAFSTIINMVQLDGNTVNNAAIRSNPPLIDSASTIIDASRLRIYEACCNFINVRKDLAVLSTFYYPGMFYCEAFYCDVAADMDVHGVSVYLALLQAATGIKTNRLPDFTDEAKGTVHFLGSQMSSALAHMWTNENIGKSYHSCLSGRNKLREFAPSRRVPGHKFIWSYGYDSTERLARMCIDGSAGNAPYRTEFAKYVEQFCSYFTASNLLPSMISALTGEDADYGRRTDDLNVIFHYMTDSGLLPRQTNVDQWQDVRHALWDLDASPAQVRTSIAVPLFSFLGVLKTSSDSAEKSKERDASEQDSSVEIALSDIDLEMLAELDIMDVSSVPAMLQSGEITVKEIKEIIAAIRAGI